jgi:hypothetical protein
MFPLSPFLEELAMFDITKSRAAAGSMSAFITLTELRRSGFDIWAEAGRATELAYRDPTPMSQAVRIAVALVLVVAAKLCSAGVLQ